MYKCTVYEKNCCPSLTGQKDDIGSLGITLELCAGIVDKEGKSLAEIAAEEVEEECGYHVDLKQVEFVQTFRGAIGTGSLNEKWITEIPMHTWKSWFA